MVTCVNVAGAEEVDDAVCDGAGSSSKKDENIDGRMLPMEVSLAVSSEYLDCSKKEENEDVGGVTEGVAEEDDDVVFNPASFAE